MATTKLTRTLSASNLDKWTFSTWVKKSGVTGYQQLIAAESGSAYTIIKFETGGEISFENYDSGGGAAGVLKTNRLFRDPAAWYHIVAVWDSDNGTPGDRMKIYVNGVEETSFSNDSNPDSDEDSTINSAVVHWIGARDTSDYLNGVLAHTHFCDGQAYAASDFGSTDATSGMWIPNTGPSVTYGTNGFFLKYASGALGTDSSGESNDFVVSGTMTNTKDNAQNNFCTLNSLFSSTSRVEGTYTNANATYVTTASNYKPTSATIGLTAGLWYFEAKQTQKAGTQEIVLGITGDQATMDYSSNYQLGWSAMQHGMYMGDGKSYTNNTGTAYGSASAQDDILGCYIDLTANKLYFAINGTVQNSGTGITITAASAQNSNMWVPAISGWSGDQQTIEFNFGNGYFGTTAVTSGVADAGGEGTFEYDPSAGTFDSASKDFRAICTNNLGTYGG
jgi:hypothetical protein